MPKIGMRMIKTSIAVAICLLIYLLRGKQGVPVFSTIAAMICMQPYVENSKTCLLYTSSMSFSNGV